MSHKLPMVILIATSTIFSPLALADPTHETQIKRAREALNWLRTGQYDAFVGASNDTMKAALPAEKLADAWRQVTGAFGDYKSESTADVEGLGEYTVVVLHCAFERSDLDVTVSFDADKKIAGLFFKPAQPQLPYAPPPYVDPSRFVEEEVTIAADPNFPLAGTLTLPKTDGRVPAVVLVHGSGPNDRNETIYGNKPFKDIAGGLASRGIAVLRYEKRTKKYGGVLNAETITIDGETADDAIAAARLLMNRKEIRGEAVFLLGHSLGATAAPYIGAKEPRLAGLILMAAAARPIYELVEDQVSYLAQLDGRIDDAERQQIESVRATVDKLRNGTWTKEDALLGAPASYWAGLDNLRPVETARTLDKPMLILQGGRDYQVTDLDFEIWRSALKGKKKVRPRRFDDLDHLFRPGEGPSSPKQYEETGHVDESVIREISHWIRVQSEA